MGRDRDIVLNEYTHLNNFFFTTYYRSGSIKHAGKARQDSMLQEFMDSLDTFSVISHTMNTASKEHLSFHHYYVILDMSKVNNTRDASII